MPSSLLDQLQRILPLADKVANEIVCEETEILEKIIPRVFEVMQRVAKFLCDYVKHGRFRTQPPFFELVNANDHRENRRNAHLFEGQGND